MKRVGCGHSDRGLLLHESIFRPIATGNVTANGATCDSTEIGCGCCNDISFLPLEDRLALREQCRLSIPFRANPQPMGPPQTLKVQVRSTPFPLNVVDAYDSDRQPRRRQRG